VTWLALILAVVGWGQGAPARDYAVGQVWAVQGRAEDVRPSVKVQAVEGTGAATIYHVSAVGVRLGGRIGELRHLPVSRATLDASVIGPGDATLRFPEAAEGIVMWRALKGGVFTVPLAEVFAFADRSVTAATP
jgi:hypothetical protein